MHLTGVVDDAQVQKMGAYANRDPEITAQNIDFSKPIDAQGEENKAK